MVVVLQLPVHPSPTPPARHTVFQHLNAQEQTGTGGRHGRAQLKMIWKCPVGPVPIARYISHSSAVSCQVPAQPVAAHH